MITLERFGAHADAARHALEAVAATITRAVGRSATLTLETAADAATLERMLELEQEIFAIEDNVYSRQDILDCLAEEDSLLLLLRIGGRIEGYVFGYDEDPADPVVKGADYFLDSALVAAAYEQKGIGAATAGVVLLLLYLAGYRDIGLTTEPRDRTGRELVKFYRKLGFTDAETAQRSNYAMKIHLDGAFAARMADSLGITLPKE